MEGSEEDKHIVCVIGNANVGKTCLIKWQEQNGKFNIDEPPTVATEFYHVKVQTPSGEIELKVRDRPGDCFGEMTQTYFNNSKALVCCFNINDPSTLESLCDMF